MVYKLKIMLNCNACKRIILLCFCRLCVLSFHHCINYQENDFQTIADCDKNYFRNVSALVTYNSVSQIECAAKCNSVTTCSGINYGAASGVRTCQLLPSLITALSCSELQPYENCSYFHKGPCLNGGLYQPEHGTCLCPYNFAGAVCERYFTDCVEAYDLGYREAMVTIVQPSPELSPFRIRCRLEEGPVARIVKRNKDEIDLFDGRLWNDYKLGFGTPARNNMWLGLDNIHALLSVGNRPYTAKITVTFSGDSSSYIGYLDNFLISSEAEDYAISFSGFRSDDSRPLTDAFTESNSVNGRPFCTSDKDCNDCARNSNSGWWFSLSCAGVNWNLPVDKLAWTNGSQSIPVDKLLVDILPLT